MATRLPCSTAATPTRNATVTRSASSSPVARLITTLPASPFTRLAARRRRRRRCVRGAVRRCAASPGDRCRRARGRAGTAPRRLLLRGGGRRGIRLLSSLDPFRLERFHGGAVGAELDGLAAGALELGAGVGGDE